MISSVMARKLRVPKAAPGGAALQAETTVPLKWIASRLQRGTWTYLNHRLYWERRASR